MPNPNPSPPSVYLIDGSGYIFRAYHALPPLTRKSDALPVGAVAGFCAMLFKLLNETEPMPSHIGVAFDPKGKTFRNQLYQAYKVNRPPPPEDLVPQFALMRDACRAFGLSVLEQQGFEADDVIATYTRQAQQANMRVTIVSSDKDLMQLVSKQVAMLDTMKHRHIDEAAVQEKFGVLPHKVIDVQALAGDSSDNIPGVPGIGVKTAAQLITDYGDLDTLLGKASEIKQPKRRESLVDYADQARLSRQLVTLDDDVKSLPKLDTLKHKPIDAKELIGFLKAMEFVTLTKRVAQYLGVEADSIAPNTRLRSSSLPLEVSQKSGHPNGQSLMDMQLMPLTQQKTFARDDYVCVQDMAELESWIAQAMQQGYVAVDTETSSLNAVAADLLGLSLALAPNKACYVPLGHCDTAGARLPNQLEVHSVLDKLRQLLSDPAVLKILHNAKYDMLILRQSGLALTPIDDTMLLSYVLDTGRGRHGLDELMMRYFGHSMVTYKSMVGSGRSQIGFAQVALADATQYAAEDADATLRLWLALKPRLLKEGLATIYETLERPLVPVLVDMEATGVEIDKAALADLSQEFLGKMTQLETRVHALAGEVFNMASPAQLGKILFEKMSLPGGSKTKTGIWSTTARELELLAAGGHEIASHMLAWRTLAKLRSTYTDALPQFILPTTGRVHSSYALASTSTGRLSSSDPNLQNIPIRTEDGRRIRQAFVAPKGHVLLSADYSQIELRVLAHLADIPALKKAFKDGQDIHASTASEIFATPLDKVDNALRRRAKAINFGIIYGISAFGLAQQLGITQEDARHYIKAYFEKFPGIKAYMDAQRDHIRHHAYVETLFGRRMHYNLKAARTAAEKSFMERAAINAPIQGTAADVMRRAMILLLSALSKADLKAKMLMQVHDELVLECPKNEAKALAALAKDVMQNAPAPALQFSVPLVVEANWGDTWDAAH